MKVRVLSMLILAAVPSLGLAQQRMETRPVERFGETLPRDMAAAVSPSEPIPNNSRGKLHGIFTKQLRSSKPQSVEGFGNVRALQIRVPKQKESK